MHATTTTTTPTPPPPSLLVSARLFTTPLQSETELPSHYSFFPSTVVSTTLSADVCISYQETAAALVLVNDKCLGTRSDSAARGFSAPQVQKAANKRNKARLAGSEARKGKCWICRLGARARTQTHNTHRLMETLARSSYVIS